MPIGYFSVYGGFNFLFIFTFAAWWQRVKTLARPSFDYKYLLLFFVLFNFSIFYQYGQQSSNYFSTQIIVPTCEYSCMANSES